MTDVRPLEDKSALFTDTFSLAARHPRRQTAFRTALVGGSFGILFIFVQHVVLLGALGHGRAIGSRPNRGSTFPRPIGLPGVGLSRTKTLATKAKEQKRVRPGEQTARGGSPGLSFPRMACVGSPAARTGDARSMPSAGWPHRASCPPALTCFRNSGCVDSLPLLLKSLNRLGSVPLPGCDVVNDLYSSLGSSI